MLNKKPDFFKGKTVTMQQLRVSVCKKMHPSKCLETIDFLLGSGKIQLSGVGLCPNWNTYTFTQNVYL